MTLSSLRAYTIPCAVALLALTATPGQTLKADDPDEQQLIAVLESNAPAAEKAITCKKLAVYGSGQAVPALARLLVDRELSSWARIALESIPDPAAGAALRTALDQLDGRLAIGVINSLAARRDADAVDSLAQRLTGADPDVAAAAALALGSIGNLPAANHLEQALATAPDALRSAVAEGCVCAAQQLLKADQRANAVKLYDLVRQAAVPRQRIIEATRGAILARGTEGLALLREQLQSSDPQHVAIGLSTARELPGQEVTTALAAELSQLAPERQSLLLLALADRRDSAALPTVLESARRGPLPVRLAAIRAVPQLGDRATLSPLLEIAAEGDSALTAAVLEALLQLPGEDIDAELLARLARPGEALRRTLIDVVGQRRLAAAVPLLRQAADDSDPQIRAAALTALGSTVDLDGLAILIERAVKPLKPEDAPAARKALLEASIRMPDRDACAEQLMAALTRADADTQVALVEVLGAVGGPKALEALAAAATQGSPALKDAASRLLGEWMSADAAPVLLDVARRVSEGRYKNRALRGYLRIARQLDVPGPERVDMCRQALGLCQRDEEKRLVLEVLERNPSPQSLQLAASLLAQSPLRDDASRATLVIAEKILETDRAAAADAAQQVIAAKPSADLVERAKALAQRAKQ